MTEPKSQRAGSNFRRDLTDPDKTDVDATDLDAADYEAANRKTIELEATDLEATDLEATDGASIDPFSTFIPAAQRGADSGPVRYDALVRGDQIGDFRIQRLLGRGSFGAVYLARELTLDRLVAVKVVMPEGQRATAGEGRSLAQLRHRNIVGVFGEAFDLESGCSLLWMQFVDGCNLATLIDRLRCVRVKRDWTEADVKRILSPFPGQDEDDDQHLRSRGSLETVCRIGAQLAEALSHAHRCGIVHRDIKPANILMQNDGMPLLADFNLADTYIDGATEKTGGTLSYMPPEQIAQMLGETDRIDACRADVYSLGVVLWELACGCRPHAEADATIKSRGVQRIRDVLKVRRRELSIREPGLMIGLEMILRRALSVNPEKRFPSARAMATALKGLEELQRARRRAPAVTSALPFLRKHLFWIILIGGLLPHFAASVLQSVYNQIWIKPDDAAFTKAFIVYNIVVYPACVGWLAWNLYRFALGYRRVVAREPIRRGQLRKLRGRLLKLPRQFTIAAAFGWFPGVVLFPWLLGIFGPPPSTEDWTHYAISFTIAGMIATTYSYALVVYLVGVLGYRACWQTGTHYRVRARYELRGMEKRISWISVLTGVLPLAAAVLLLVLAPQAQLTNPGDLSQVKLDYELHQQQVMGLYRLVIALIVSGGIGLYLVVMGSARLIRVVRALTLSQD